MRTCLPLGSLAPGPSPNPTQGCRLKMELRGIKSAVQGTGKFCRRGDPARPWGLVISKFLYLENRASTEMKRQKVSLPTHPACVCSVHIQPPVPTSSKSPFGQFSPGAAVGPPPPGRVIPPVCTTHRLPSPDQTIAHHVHLPSSFLNHKETA